MNIIRTILLLSILSVGSLSVNASGGEKNVILKKGGAVSAFSEEDGFKLTPKAIKNLGVSFTPIKGNGPWTLPKSSIVRIKNSYGVYRKWNGWITLVFIKILNQTNKTITIKSVDLQDEDLVAISGVSFLRMTEADLNSDTVDACAH